MVRDWNDIVMAYDNAGNALDHIMIGENIVWRFREDGYDGEGDFYIINYKIGDYPVVVKEESYLYEEGRNGVYGNSCIAVDMLIYFKDRSKKENLTLNELKDRYWQLTFNNTINKGYKIKYIKEYSKNVAVYRFYIDVLIRYDGTMKNYYLEIFDLYPNKWGNANTDMLEKYTYMFTDANKISKLLFNTKITNTKSVTYDPTE